MKKLILFIAFFSCISITISAQCLFKISVDTIYHPTCFGSNTGAIFLKTTNAQLPVNFNWGNGITGKSITSLSGGKYSVTATDNAGCRDSLLNTVVIQPDTPFISVLGVIPATGILAAKLPVIVRKGNNRDTFYISINVSGTQNIVITDRQGCTYSRTVTVVLSALNDQYTEGSLKFDIVQKNSHSATVFIQLNEEKEGALNVFNVDGQSIHNQSFREKDMSINLTNLPSGVLLFSLKIKDKIFIKKMVFGN